MADSSFIVFLVILPEIVLERVYIANITDINSKNDVSIVADVLDSYCGTSNQ